MWPDERTRQQLNDATRDAVDGTDGKPVSAANLHITLAFLHFVETDRLECIQAAASRVECEPFDLDIREIGHFKRAKILWAGPTTAPRPLVTLVGDLWRELKPCGFTAETRPFNAHVTLARKIRRMPHEAGMRPVSWRVGSIALVESVTKPSGARYAVLDTWALNDS